VEVLGFDPGDAKVYVLEHRHDESGELPQLSFWALAADGEPRRAQVRSWYTGDATTAEAAFPERLKRLRARLQPLPATGAGGIELRVQQWDVRPCSAQPLGATAEQRSAARELTRGKPFRALVELPPDDKGLHAGYVSMCQVLHADIVWGEHRAEAALESWGALELVASYRLPAPQYRLVVLRHLGHTHETGYAADVPLLLRAAPAEVAGERTESPAAKRHAACRAGLRHTKALGDPLPETSTPGRWAQALAPDELGFGRWSKATLHGQELAGRAVRVLEVDRVDDTYLVVGQPQLEGGVCVLGTWGMQFGGLGVQGDVTRAVRSGDGRSLVVVHRADALYRGYHDDQRRYVAPKEERVWTVLLVTPEGMTKLDTVRQEAERVEVYWGGPGRSRSVELKALDAAGKLVWQRKASVRR